MGYSFGRNWDGNSNTAGYADQIFMKEILENKRRRANRMRLLM